MELFGRYMIGFTITSLLFMLVALIVQAEASGVCTTHGRSGEMVLDVKKTTTTTTVSPVKVVELLVGHSDTESALRRVTPTTTTTVVTKFSIPKSTTTTIPYLVDQIYGYYEKGNHIRELQQLIGMDQVDGIYGKNTRRKHMDWFGSNREALRHFNDRNQWYIEAIDPEPADEYLEEYWLDRPTLGELVEEHFEPEHRSLFLKIAFCESSAQPEDTFNDAVSPALAVGAFQHMARYWRTRSEDASMKGWDIFDMKAHVKVASLLFYTSGIHHWNPSRKCWG